MVDRIHRAKPFIKPFIKRNISWTIWVLTFNLGLGTFLGIPVYDWKYWIFVAIMSAITIWHGNRQVKNYQDLENIKRRLVGKDDL